MTYLEGDKTDPFLFDFDTAKEKGRELAADYAAAEPFPHIVIDDFLPHDVLDYVMTHFPSEADPDSRDFDRAQERYKRSYQPDYLEPKLRSLFYAFNARPFIRVIENITGIKGLIPDPYFAGGGFHEVSNGGHLSIHTDFNHHKPMNLERRVNVLIYLNPDWKPEYGGQLEFWTTDMKTQVETVVPIANRCAIFTTSEHSMHGNPEPVAHPDGTARRSIALYYYTATWEDTRRPKTTQFQVRPGSQDQNDWQVKRNEFLQEFLPPAVSRRILHRLNKH